LRWTADGPRSTSTARPARRFAIVHGELSADRCENPVYGQLRNLIDLAVAAAFIQKQDYCGQVD
jgi:hypothetical protein